MKKRFQLCSLLIASLLFLLALPFHVFGADNFVFEPYANITSLASGIQAYQNVKRLTEKDMAGRQPGTEGCNKAAEWIAAQFKQYGLHPYHGDSYFQACQVPYFNFVPPMHFQYKDEDDWIETKFREDFNVCHYSGEGKINNQSVFIGYGIESPNDNFNEYEKIAVSGKTVLMMLDLPPFFKERRQEFSFYNRIQNAYQKGASSVVLLLKQGVSPPFRFDMKIVRGFDAFIPVLISSSALSETLLSQSNLVLDELTEYIDQNKKPASRPLELVLKIEVHFEMEDRISNNVIGYIPAIDPKVKDSILITSHYDGLGYDRILNSFYHGANDNASATGCIMEIARNLMNKECLPSVNLVFIAFTGEEEGLIGSSFYLSHPLFPLKGIKAVLNSEEIGTKEGVNIAGTSRSIYPELSRLITSSAKYLKTDISLFPELLYPGSDHYPFHEKGIPSVCFAKLPLPNGFPEYHTTDDTIDIISPESLGIFCRLLTLMTLSYSESAYIDFSDLPFQSHTVRPFIISTCESYIQKDSSLFLTVNGEKVDFPIQNESFFDLSLFFPLGTGQNEFIVSVETGRKKWITRSFTVSCDPDKRLRADFNTDWKVDLTDLMLMAKKMETVSPPYTFDSVYDLDQDRSITLSDYEEFLSIYGSI